MQEQEIDLQDVQGLRSEADGATSHLRALAQQAEQSEEDFEATVEEYESVVQPHVKKVIAALLHWVPDGAPEINVTYTAGGTRTYTSDALNLASESLLQYGREDGHGLLSTIADAIDSLKQHLPTS